jgi:mono/diheme cytochrome c family protein
MRAALAVVSIAWLAFSGVELYKQYHSPWQSTQMAYFQQALVQAKTGAERSALEQRQPRIEQTIVTAFGAERVDRCQSCHIASDDPNFATGKEPVKTHPYSAEMGDVLKDGRWERRHKFSDFGCTACHDGQGRGLDADDAHGVASEWPTPMLGYAVQEDWDKNIAKHLRDKDYMQANCVQCHTDKDFAGAPWVKRGRELFFKTGCFGCHKIEGLASGTLGVDLTDVGTQRKLDYLWGHIVNPRDYTVNSIMPQFKLSDDDRKALVIFLKSQRGQTNAEAPVDRYRLDTSTKPPVPLSVAEVDAQIKAATSPAARGEQLIQGYACLSCHKLNDHDGGISPDLSYEGLIRDQDWLMAHFRVPRSRIPDSNMPAFGLPDSDFGDMTAYLLARTTPPPAMTPAETFHTLCARCHGDKGDGKGTSAIYLDPAPRDLTRAEFMNSKPETRFITSIHQGVAGTSMPPWGKVLSDDQIKGVFDYISTNFVHQARHEIKPRKVPDVNPVPMSAASAARGQAIFTQRCIGCHGRKADGKGPNSVDISPRPRNLRNSAFIDGVADRRLFESILYGVDGTAMPSWIDYGLSQDEVGDIVNYIRSLNAGTAVKTQASASNTGGTNGSIN